jgi:hypothetical protein
MLNAIGLPSRAKYCGGNRGTLLAFAVEKEVQHVKPV